jgi:hypothetical protein
MPKTTRTDLRALRNMIDEANLLLTTTELPEGRSKRARELLGTALKLADYLLKESPAVTLGKLGGRKIAERGPDYFRQLAAKRKTRAGGRPRKQQ